MAAELKVGDPVDLGEKGFFVVLEMREKDDGWEATVERKRAVPIPTGGAPGELTDGAAKAPDTAPPAGKPAKEKKPQRKMFADD
jgi:hypothetical protein